MDDAGWLGKALQTFGPWVAAWAATCMAAVQYFKARNERKRDIHAERSGDWDRIRSERDVAREERDMVRDRWAECERELIEERAAHMKLKAYHEGLGEARQDAARIVAAERLIDAAKKANGNGGGE